MLFSSILTIIQPILINVVCDSNNQVITRCRQMYPSEFGSLDIDIMKMPIWMLSGGEAINLYSTTQTQTKDLDFKNLLVGNLSIDPIKLYSVIYNGEMPEEKFAIANSLNWKTLFLVENITHILGTEYKRFVYCPCDFDKWNEKYSIIKHATDSMEEIIMSVTKNPIYKLVNESRRDIVIETLVSFKKKNQVEFLQSFHDVIILFDDVTKILYNNGFDALYSIVGPANTQNGIIPIRIVLPFFSLDYNKYYSCFPYVPLTTDANHTNASLLNVINPDLQGLLDCTALITMLDDWYSLSDTFKRMFANEFLRMTDFSNLRTYLRSLTNVILYVEKVDGSPPYNWKIKVEYEGVLDLFIDPSAGHAKKGKLIYEGKYADGSIPCIIEPINYCSLLSNTQTMSYIKIPTVSWLLRDQERMLFHAIRGVDTLHQWTADTFVMGISGIDPIKYYSKVAGLLESQMKAITALQNNTNNIRDHIISKFNVNCNNVFMCGPDAFISYAIQILNNEYWKRLSVICSVGRGAYKKKKRKLTRKKGN